MEERVSSCAVVVMRDELTGILKVFQYFFISRSCRTISKRQQMKRCKILHHFIVLKKLFGKMIS